MIVEGGGTSRVDQAPLRRGFQLFFEKVGLRASPKVICAGARAEAFKDFRRIATEASAACLLLVDSEGPVAAGHSPWEHVAVRDGDHWRRPEGVLDSHLHFMCESMETWLASDPTSLPSDHLC
jgi:Domain of unknown function (DUF4276)